MNYRIEYACVSHRGLVRKCNQDNCIVCGRCRESQKQDTELMTGSVLSTQTSLFGVFDGMGGEECGEEASRIAARDASRFQFQGDTVDSLARLCFQANQDICSYALTHGVLSMGTTAAMLAFDQKGIALCNIGDSRIFRWSEGHLEQISVDHVMPAPYGMKPSLSQNLGISPEEMVIEPYLARMHYREGDMYVICSDGLTDMVSEKEISQVLSSGPPGETAMRLLNMALDRGGKDNVTVLLCKILRHPGRFFDRR